MSVTGDEGTWPPEQIEEYRLIRQLGRGGMGVVYLAEDRLLARLVAIKLIHAPSPDVAARARFFVEARAIARLSHPNVVSIFRVGEVRGRPFLVSEYVRGQSLAELHKPVEPRQVLAIAVELARGLAAAHRRGVLHRDIKPANAMIEEDGTVKLLDFGLAELVPGAEAYDRGDAQSVYSSDVAPPSTVDLLSGMTEKALPGGAGFVPVRISPGHADAISTVDLVCRPNRAASPGASPFASTREVAPRLGTATRPRTKGVAPRKAPQTLAGTPLYMAPELWNLDPATPSADVYALGVVIYELCCGAPPLADLPLATRLREVIPPFAEAVPGVDPRLAAVVDRCLRRDPSLRYPDGDALREALEQISAPAAPTIEEGAVLDGNPYRGLLAFEAEHRRLFFGRRAEILAIVDRLRADPFVLVAGDSGTGKSSLCRAGVLPAVAGGALGHPVATATVLLGRHPLDALAAAIAPLLGGDEAAIAERLRAEPAAVARDLVRCRGAVLLFIDQLEELSTLASQQDAASAAAALHGLAGRTGRVRLLATARSDFLTRLSALPDLGDDLPAALYLLRPLTSERLREAVIGPAAAKGFSFESDAIVETLVCEALRAPGGLPLLQFALAELWEARNEVRRVIPTAVFEVQGGVPSALGRHADSVLARVPPPHRAAFRAILLALVTAEGTRARRSEAELLDASRGLPGAHAALDALVRGRLLVAREGEDGEGSVFELAHEALLSGWVTLRGWLGHDAEGRAQRERIERAAAEWDRAGRPADALWATRLLAEVAAVEERSLTKREAVFLAASRRANRRRELWRWAAGLAVPLAVGVGALGVHIRAVLGVDRRVDEARRELERAHVARGEVDELRRVAFARFDAGDLEQAERDWAVAQSRGAEAEKAFAAVCGHLELVLQQDAGRKDASALLAEALYKRAVMAARDGRAAERDELVRRLEVTSDHGAASRWDDPAHLVVETSPSGAAVALERFVLQEERWVAVPEAPLGPTPVAHHLVPPGSVVLVFSAPGRASVRLPILIERGEVRRIALTLPLATTVPEGFVLVPPGQFLYGSAGADARTFFSTQPLHPVETGAYFIAENETTFAEWIAFLRSLPPVERIQRMPRTGEKGFVVALAELPDGDYELTFGQETHRSTARMGEPFHYLGRDRRLTQDWTRFPVSGIVLDDVLAYAAWLDRTGRVPGARVCDEHEWERAARGADGRSFPGGERLFADDANIDVTYGRNRLGFGPDEVGSHRASDSPFGVHDMAGNVWEFTLSSEDRLAPVVRGGSSFQLAVDARGENRNPLGQTHRDAFVGARICATPRSP